jgi:hypothetical protein
VFEWQALGESGRQVWMDKSLAAKAEYERQLEEYKKKLTSTKSFKLK